MAYITRIQVKKCRNVRDLEIDLTIPPPEDLTPESSERTTRPVRHLILTGPNGSGKSGILEGAADELIMSLLPPEDAGRVRNAQRRRRERDRISMKPVEPARTWDAELNRMQGGPSLKLAWTAESALLPQMFEQGEMIAIYLPPRRHIRHQDVRGPTGLDWKPVAMQPERHLSSILLQFLVNKQAEMAFAIAKGDRETALRVKEWLARFERHMRWLTGDPRLDVEFNQPAYNFRFKRSDGYVFDLNSLADGHAAVLSLLAEILLRVEVAQRALSDFNFEPEGVVVVDEIETHLHLTLQEQLLPFVTELFPRLQFLVATHSPAVIASIPGAVVCDLGTREQELSDRFRGVPYGTLMTEHFGISSEIDLDSTRRLLRLRELGNMDSLNLDEIEEFQRLSAELSARSPALATEVWMLKKRIGGSNTHVGGDRR